jgi:hypothetical protein
LLLLGGLLHAAVLPADAAGVVAYPAPPGLQASEDFTLQVNGQPVWVEKLRSMFTEKDVPSWFPTQPHTKLPLQVNLANFSGNGPFSVALTAAGPIASHAIRPKSRGIRSVVDGRTLRFEIPHPDNLYIEVDALPALCLFANPLETGAPKPDDPGVRYFGPGVHRPGRMELKDDQTIYIAGGAVVYGTVSGSPARARIRGRGILDGNYEGHVVSLFKASEVEVEGVLLRNGREWQNILTDCSDVAYRNVKVVSFGNSGDGIDPVGGRRVTVDGCFLRCTDDCIAIKATRNDQAVEAIQVLNSTLIGYAFGDGVTVGYETNGPHVKDIAVRNCDILIARGGSKVGGHSAFSVICDGPARISGILFEDIRVEERVEKLLEFQVTDGTMYQKDPPGHIAGVRLKNVRWEVEKPIVLKGFDEEHRVEDVTFEDCTVAGRKLKDLSDPLFRVNPHVKDVKFK